jgi:hypothetical protein
MCPDDFYHAVRVFKHFIIPETQHMKTGALQMARALGILLPAIGMLAAIHLNDKPVFKTYEINDVVIDGLLTAELCSKLFPVQAMPQMPLRIGHIFS